MTYNTELNYSDDTHMKNDICYILFQDTIWNVISIVYHPFKDVKEVKLSYLKHLYTQTQTCTNVCTYISLNIKL